MKFKLSYLNYYEAFDLSYDTTWSKLRARFQLDRNFKSKKFKWLTLYVHVLKRSRH